MTDLFYLQDSRGYVGNDMLFWRPGGAGYTTDLREAATYTSDEAQAKHSSRPSDIPWPKSYIDARTRPACDMQYVKRGEALQGTGITLQVEEPARRETVRCHGCGVFLSEKQLWSSGCPKCGVDNRP